MDDSIVQRDPDILGGTAVFRGTRVPVRILSEHLEAGDGLDVFLTDFPSVTREQATTVLAVGSTSEAVRTGGRLDGYRTRVRRSPRGSGRPEGAPRASG